jgi:hypothetical protein
MIEYILLLPILIFSIIIFSLNYKKKKIYKYEIYITDILNLFRYECNNKNNTKIKNIIYEKNLLFNYASLEDGVLMIYLWNNETKESYVLSLQLKINNKLYYERSFIKNINSIKKGYYYNNIVSLYHNNSYKYGVIFINGDNNFTIYINNKDKNIKQMKDKLVISLYKV